MLAFFIVFAALGGYLLGSIPFGLVLTRAAGPRRHPRDRLRQYRRDQRAAHRAQGSGARDAAARRRQGRPGAVAGALACWRSSPADRDRSGRRRRRFCRPLLSGVAWLQRRQGRRDFLRRAVRRRLAAGDIGGRRPGSRSRPCFGYSSLAALGAAAIAPVAAAIAGFELFANRVHRAAGGLIFWRHRANIARLRAGTEPRIGGASKRRGRQPSRPRPRNA